MKRSISSFLLGRAAVENAIPLGRAAVENAIPPVYSTRRIERTTKARKGIATNVWTWPLTPRLTASREALAPR